MTTDPKEIIFAETAKEKLKNGINILADIAKVTLGPKGRNVAITSWSKPKITNDSFNILDEIDLKDQFEDMGANFGKDLAYKIKEASGDGTTTGIILLQSLVNEGLKNITSGVAAIDIRRGMEKALKKVLKEIDKMKSEIKTDLEIKNIATACAGGNEDIGEDIATAFKKAKKNGVITIEEGKTTTTEIEVVEGMQIDRGYLSPYFCTNPEKMIVELESVKVLVTDKKINSIQDLLPILKSCTTKELLIIADELAGDALSTLVINKLKGVIKVVAIKTPAFGEERRLVLEDIASLTGATFISEEKGLFLKEASFEDLGELSKVIVTKDKTTMIGGKGFDIEKRILQLQKEKELEEDEIDRDRLEKRIANLQDGVVLIKVGSTTESELKQKKQLYDDSLNSTKAAIESGISTGGGITLFKACLKIKELPLTKDEKIGADILFKACKAPLKQLILNSGAEAEVIIEEILTKKENFGFNVKTEEIEDLVLAGVIDPTKVIKTALTHAVSSASVLLLSEVLIGDYKE